MIKNILWHFEGALFDTSSAMTFAVSKTLKQMDLLVPLNVINGLVRQSFEYCVITLARRFKIDAEELRSQLIEAYYNVPPASQLPLPGVSRVCKYVHENGGQNIVLTPFSVRVIKPLIDVHGLAPLFDKILYIKQSTVEESDPDIVQMTLNLCELDAGETLLLSNHAGDIQSGKISGVRTCLFGKIELLPCVDYQIDNYSQLLDVLRETNNT